MRTHGEYNCSPDHLLGGEVALQKRSAQIARPRAGAVARKNSVRVYYYSDAEFFPNVTNVGDDAAAGIRLEVPREFLSGLRRVDPNCGGEVHRRRWTGETRRRVNGTGLAKGGELLCTRRGGTGPLRG